MRRRRRRLLSAGGSLSYTIFISETTTRPKETRKRNTAPKVSFPFSSFHAPNVKTSNRVRFTAKAEAHTVVRQSHARTTYSSARCLVTVSFAWCGRQCGPIGSSSLLFGSELCVWGVEKRESRAAVSLVQTTTFPLWPLQKLSKMHSLAHTNKTRKITRSLPLSQLQWVCVCVVNRSEKKMTTRSRRC